MCDNFRVDLAAASFNTCVCGAPKSAHAFASPKKQTKRGMSFDARALRHAESDDDDDDDEVVPAGKSDKKPPYPVKSSPKPATPTPNSAVSEDDEVSRLEAQLAAAKQRKAEQAAQAEAGQDASQATQVD